MNTNIEIPSCVLARIGESSLPFMSETHYKKPKKKCCKSFKGGKMCKRCPKSFA